MQSISLGVHICGFLCSVFMAKILMFSGNKSQIQTAESAVVRKTFLYFFSGGK